MFFFMISIAFNFILAINIPLWVLLVGPLLLGVPHLVSSLRYVPQLTNIKLLSVPLVGGLFIFVAAVRLAFGSWGVNNVELASGLLLIGLVSFYYKEKKMNVFFSIFLLGGLFAATLSYPLETIGALILAHNFIAFFFWLNRAPSQADKMTAGLSLVIFSVMTAAILLGFFDSWMSNRMFEIFNGFNDNSIGSQIFPHADMIVWSRAVSAYALGQGIHYFVWLKAIPEQELPYEHTTNFTYSLKLLRSNMGNRIIYFTGLILIGILAFALLRNFVEARFIYLSLAAFHGYFEIMALPFVKMKTL
jgi:hypothetical protein